ncbi:BrnA antitoxin family protein [Sphingomonas sp. M6A6_1c]
MNRPDPTPPFDADPDFDDNPEWTKEDFAKARPASEVLPPEIVAMLVRSDTEWEEVTLHLDPDVIEKFRATGPGWEARINAVLRDAEPFNDIQSHAA